jgi:hypothetical protein
MGEVVERSNLKLAHQRVVENKGAPGVDDGSKRKRFPPPSVWRIVCSQWTMDR